MPTEPDAVFYCTLHRRKLTWMPNPGWWIHDDNRPSTGHPGDPRGCSSMWESLALLTITRRETLHWRADDEYGHEREVRRLSRM